MLDNQEEKIKYLIKEKGFGIEEAIKKLDISKQTFYNNIRRNPLSNSFKGRVKKKLGIDLEESLIDKETPKKEDELESLRKQVKEAKEIIFELQKEIIDLLKKKGM